MGKFSVLVVIVFLGVIAMFSLYNNDATMITIPFGEPVEIPKIGLILISSVFGALTMLVLFMVRDSMRFMVNYQVQRVNKRSDKITALYNQSLNAILGENTTLARTSLEQILKMDPEHSDALLRLGNMDVRAQEYEQAATYYRRALDSSNNNLEALFSLAEVMQRLMRWDDAIEYINSILTIDSGNISALTKLRALLERDSKWSDLIEVQKSIVHLERDSDGQEAEASALLGYRYELARGSLAASELDAASKGFKGILKENDQFIPAHLSMSEVMSAQDNTDGAVEYLEKAYETTRSQMILVRLEELLIDLGDPLRLIRIYQHRLSQEQDNTELRFFLAKLFFRLEMVDDAFRELETLDDTFPEVPLLLGELYMRRQQCEKAVVQFKKTMKLSKALRIPFKCSACGNAHNSWSGRCPSCGSWNSLNLKVGAVQGAEKLNA
jgi:lipopolysaccharide biosynthesis regulator YciM